MAIGIGRIKVPEVEETAPEVSVDNAERLQEPLPWLAKETRLPELRATARDYLERPNTIEGLGKVYTKAEPSFMSMGKAPLETIAPVSPTGDVGPITQGSEYRDQDRTASASAEIPQDSLMLVHSHPFGNSPEPSPKDFETATKIGAPNFELSRDQLYVAPPGGNAKQRPIKVADVRSGKGNTINLKWNKDQPVIVEKPSRVISTGYPSK